MSEQVYVGLGSNQDEPQQQLCKAVIAMQTIPDTKLLRVSGIYVSRPMGPPDQDDYLNAVAELETRLLPEELLDALQAIERRQGRCREGERWQQRPLDLDILLYGNKRINSEHLVVPHPGMHVRAFVLYPLQELEGDIEIPGKGHISTLIRNELHGEVLRRLEQSICQ